MPITPADSLDLLIAHGPPDATDFAKQIAGLPGAYYAGLDEAYKRRNQDAFQNGVPTDLPSLYKSLLTLGGTPAGIEVAKGLQHQQAIQAVQDAGKDAFGGGIPGAPPPTGTTTPPGNMFSAPAAPRVPSDGTGQSVTGIISSSPFTGKNADYVAAAVKRQLGFDATQQLSPQQVAQVQQFVDQVPRPQQPQQPQQAPQPTPNQVVSDRFPGPNGAPAPAPSTTASDVGMASVTNDPTLGGLIPPGRTYRQQLSFLQQKAAAAEVLQKGSGKVFQDAAAKIEERLLPTPEYKNYLAGKRPGETFPDWLDRDARDKREFAVLKDSIIPMIDKSREGASAAVKDIEAISRVNEQLNADKGIISGIRAGDRLALQKVGSFLGFDGRQVANTEAFRAAMGERVASIIRAFGSGTAISEGDRRYTQQMVGGQIELDEASIRKILDIGQRAAQATISKHNDLFDRTAKTSPELKRYSDSYRVEGPTAKNAAAATISEGATATNPQTKQRMIYRSGNWQPLGPQL
jgi:hypothetical protein